MRAGGARRRRDVGAGGRAGLRRLGHGYAGARRRAAARRRWSIPSVLERGEYLVRSVAGCGECHTPRDAQGNLDRSQWLAGVANRFDLTPDDDTTGGISAPNLTPEHLATWTDAQIERAFLDGVGARRRRRCSR